MKALFTDLGDVMFLGDHEGLKQAIIRRVGFLPEAFHGSNSRVFSLAQRGRISQNGLIRLRSRELGVSENEYLEFVAKLYTPNEPYHEFLREWKRAGRKLFLISNIDIVFWNHFKNHPIFSLFDDLFLSYRLRVIKPDRRIFEHCLQRTGVHPSNSLFVDDVYDNVLSAARLGMNVWNYHRQGHVPFVSFVQSILYDQERGYM